MAGTSGRTVRIRTIQAVSMRARLPTIGRRLVLLALASSLPLLLGILILASMARQTEEERLDAALLARAQAIAHAVDVEIETRRLALEGFGALLGTVEGGNLSAIDDAARRLAQTIRAPVTVLDRGLGLLVDTEQPFGTPLGSTPAVGAGLWAVETGRPRVSDVPPGSSGAPLLLVPTVREGRVVGVLGVGLQTDRLAAALAPGPAMLFDSRWRVVASQGSELAGLPGRPVLADAPRGVVQRGQSADGATTRFVVLHLGEAADWRLVTAVPAGFATSILGQLLPWALAALAIAVLVAIVVLYATGRQLRTPMLALARQARASAAALRDDAPPPPLPELGRVEEYAELGAALGEADAAGAAQTRRMRILAEAGAIVLWRADAGGGWNEAAGWAGLTGQTAPAFRGDGWLEMLHPDDRAPTLAEWGRSLVARSPIGVEFRLRTADAEADWRWVRATGAPVTDEAGQLQEWVGAIHDITDPRGAGTARQVNDSQVRQTVAELRAVYDNVPVGLSLVDRSLHFVNVNERFAAITGLPPEAHIGRAPHEVMPEGLAGPLEEAQRRAFETGRPVLDVTCSGPTPGMVQQARHWLASCHPVKNAQGEVTGVSAVLQDVTERVRAERSREMLVTELNHRVKNTLATVQSLAAQSLRGARGAQAGLGREFVGRLQALMRAHDLLSDQGWQDVDLARVVRTGITPWIESGQAVRFGGSGRIQASAGQTQAIILALHELATNATSHGALSRPGGEVDLHWSLGEDGIATLEWQESGGPAVTPPSPDARGFGLRLLERGLAHDLGPDAEVKVTFAPEGLRVRVRFRASAPALEPAEGS